MERIDFMEKNNEILKKALSEALTDKYSGELNSAPAVTEEPSPEFTNDMNNLVRKTDRPFFQYAKYTLIAACACLIVGAAIIVPSFHINNMLTGGRGNESEALPGYGDSNNLGAPGEDMAPSYEDGFKGDANYPADVPSEDRDDSIGDSVTDGESSYPVATLPPFGQDEELVPDDVITEPNNSTDVEVETQPSSYRPITNAVLSQTLSYDMFAEASLHIMGGYYGKEDYTETTVADHKAVVELIYDIFTVESVPYYDPTERDNITAYMKMCLNEGSMAYIEFVANGNVYFEEGDTIHKVNLGEERISYYVNRILDEAAEIGTQYPENQQGSTLTPATSDETLADLLDGKEIGAFTNAVIASPVSSQYPPAITDEAKLKELYKIIYTYGEDIKLTYTGGDPESYYHEYVWIQTDDDGEIDIRIAYGKIIVGKYYFFYADESVISAIYDYVWENVDSAYEGEMDYYIKPYEE